MRSAVRARTRIAAVRAMLQTLLAFPLAAAALSAQPAPSSHTVTTPLLVIPAEGAGSRATIGAITHALQLGNGTIVIADNADKRLHFFDAKGAHLRSVGRDGGGPGEFKSAGWIGECARDSVFVFDRMQNRLSVFTPDGRYARQVVLASNPVSVSCVGAGTLAAVVPGGTPGPRSYGAIRFGDLSGSEQATIDDLFLGEQLPLGATLRMTSGAGVFVFGAGDSAVAELRDAGSGTRRRIPVGIDGRSPTAAQREAAIDALVLNVSDGDRAMDARMRTMMQRMPAVKTLPAYTGLFVDAATRSLWARRSVPGDGETVLERRAFDGTLHGTVRIPRELEVFSVHGDVLVARAADASSGEESLVLYRLRGAGR